MSTGDGQDRRSLSIKQLLLTMSAGVMILAVVVILSLSGLVEKKAIRDLARDEGRQIAQLVFQSLYSAMRKGWTKDEIAEIIDRLNTSYPDMKIRVFRAPAVIAQYGEIPGEKAQRDADPALLSALTEGNEQLITGHDEIRYLYPLSVKEECQQCHETPLGGINGVVDITYPVTKLKVSLGFVINSVVLYFLVVLALLFFIIYFALRSLVVHPIQTLTTLMQEIIHHKNLEKRVTHRRSWVRELRHLGTYFNNLLSTIQDYQAKLEEFSIRDPLTGLYNRRKFEEFLRYEVHRAERHKYEFALIMLDLDNFKHINDTFGHPIGDLALKELSHVLIEATRKTDILCRLGGDEFAVLLPVTNRVQGLEVAEKLRRNLNNAVLNLPVGDTRFQASFGLVSFPIDGDNFEDLVIAMDVAMYKAKKAGKNRVETLDKDSTDASMDVFTQGQFLRRALDEDRVLPYFQPIIDMKTGKPYAFEVLARIIEEDGSIMIAADFIEAAVELGLAPDIDQRVFEKGLRILSETPNCKAKLFFNLSSRSMGNLEHMRGIPARIRAAGLDPSHIVLEITEREALPQMTQFMGVIEELHAQGISFALDDFGSGFSSFIYLKYLDIDVVKIEGSFVRHIVTDERDRIMVDHINSMSKKFGLKTVAEFVEDEMTGAMLKDMGIDYAQGFHYGIPKDKPVL